MKNNNIKNYFAGGNTPDGFFSFFNYLPYKSENIYIIKGGPGTGKSTFMKKLCTAAVELSYKTELHWCSSDNDSVDGLVIPELKTAFLDGTAPHTVDPKFPGAVDQILNFGRFWEKKKLMNYSQKIIDLSNEISYHFNKSYEILAKTKKISELQRNYYKEIIDENKLLNYSKKAVEKIIPNKNNIKVTGEKRHLFSTAITPGGIVSFLEEISNYYDKSYFIIGDKESGSSQLLKSLGERAYKFGYNTTFLHSTFDPTKVNGIIVEELKLTAVNASFPKKIKYNSKDNNIELLNISQSFYENKYNYYLDEINSLQQIMNRNTEKAVKQLQKAKSTHDELEKYYVENMDFVKLNNFTDKIIEEILIEKKYLR